MSNIITQLYDLRAARYDDTYATPHVGAENRLLASLLRKWRLFHLPHADRNSYLPRPAPLTRRGLPDRRYDTTPDPIPLRQFLDVGCGTGLTLELARLAEITLPTVRYLGIDPSRGMLAAARRKFRDYSFVRGDGETMHRWGRFDRVISLFGPLNYADADAFFPALALATRPHAIICLVAYTPLHRDAPGYILRDCQADLPITPYTAASLRHQLRRVGFRDIDIVGMSPPAFYDLHLPPLSLVAEARYFLRHSSPDDCCFLIAKGRRSWASASASISMSPTKTVRTVSPTTSKT
jgi:SAM-dependent methyltransferase